MEGHKLQGLLDLDLNPDVTLLPCVLLNRILNVPEIKFCCCFFFNLSNREIGANFIGFS